MLLASILKHQIVSTFLENKRRYSISKNSKIFLISLLQIPIIISEGTDKNNCDAMV